MESISRRGFLAGGIALSAVAADGAVSKPPARSAGALARGPANLPAGALDPFAIGVISDIHTGLPREKQKYRTGRDYPWQPGAAAALVAEILSMRNPPATVIGLGDLSLAFGEEADYQIAAATLKPLSDAGIKVVHSMGNHDIRAEFLKHFPGYDKTTKVPGRFVSVVETPHCDFFLLDSLKEPAKRGSYGACTGCEIDVAQREWLEGALAAATKPVFVCSHHPAWDVKIDKICAKAQACAGYFHGHNHRWMANYIKTGYEDDARMIRMLGLPSFGLDTDIGYGIIRTTPARATLYCRCKDFYFPAPRANPPASWSCNSRDLNGRVFHFAFG